jgi:hypothetical protein
MTRLAFFTKRLHTVKELQHAVTVLDGIDRCNPSLSACPRGYLGAMRSHGMPLNDVWVP